MRMKEENKSNQGDLGEQIFDKISSSLSDMDFEGLSENIRESVDLIRKEAEKGYKDFMVNASKESMKYSKYYETPYERYRKQAQNAGHGARYAGGRKNRAEELKNKILPIIRSTPGSIRGPLEIAGGIVGLTIFGGMTLAGIISAIAGLGAGAVAGILGTFVPLTAISGGLLGHGIFAHQRAGRLKKYNEIFKEKQFIMLEDLAKESGQTVKQILKDVTFVLKRRLAPNLSMDAKETCLLFNDEVREQYAHAEEVRLQRELEEAQKRQEAEELERRRAEATKEERQWMDFEEQYKVFYDELQEIKKEMDTPVMQEHIENIDELLSRIYVCVREHKEMISGTGHLISYYLPCMEKLFHTYLDLEEQPIQGDNIIKTKTEIENSFDTIEDALTNMYDELFRSVSMDISSDIQVLKAIMAQDGVSNQLLKN